MIVVDTSALFASLDDRDHQHDAAVTELERIVGAGGELAVPNYVVTEALSLVSRRIGMDAARAMHRSSIALMKPLWITPIEHAAAVELFLDSGRALSFVDCATMSTMRARKLQTVFTFDEDFARAGFDAVPG